MGWKTRVIFMYLVVGIVYVGMIALLSNATTDLSVSSPAYQSSIYQGNTTIGNTTFTWDDGSESILTPPVCDDLSGIDKYIGCASGHVTFLFSATFTLQGGIYTIFGWFWTPLTAIMLYIIIIDLLVPIGRIIEGLIPFT